VLSAFTYKGTGSPEIAPRLAVADRIRTIRAARAI